MDAGSRGRKRREYEQEKSGGIVKDNGKMVNRQFGRRMLLLGVGVSLVYKKRIFGFGVKDDTVRKIASARDRQRIWVWR